MATYPRRTSYGIFVKFRRSRLALRRGIVHLEDALSLAEQLRAGRFHDRGDIFVLREPDGIVVEAAPAPPPAPPVTVAPAQPETSRRWGLRPEDLAPAQPFPMGEAKPAPPTTAAPASVPAPQPPAETRPPTSPPRRPARPRASLARELTVFLRLIAQADKARSTADRARIAQARLERACQAMDHASTHHDAPPVEDLRRNQERLLALRTSSARSVESFERVAVLVERRLAVALAEATGRSTPAK